MEAPGLDALDLAVWKLQKISFAHILIMGDFYYMRYMLRNLIFRPMFFLSFIIFVTWFFLLSANAWESFNLFKAWTVTQNLKIWSSYVKEWNVQSPAVWLALAQLKVWNGTIYSRNITGNALQISSKADTLVNTDIIALMSESDDPEKVYELHQAQMKKLLDDMQNTYDELFTSSEDFRKKSVECLEKKNTWDQQFFEWANEWDESKYQEWLELSLEYAPCYITNRIQANANAYLAQRAIAYQQVLSQRYQTLWNNKEILISSYPVIRTDMAEQLVAFKQQLSRVNKTDFSEVREMFQRGIPNSDAALPSLGNIWFKDNELAVPNFVEPIKIID